jgi:uncharacterized protein
MINIWNAAAWGNLATVKRLVGRDPGLLNAKGCLRRTPLICAAEEGRVGVVRWLLDQGVGLDEGGTPGRTALFEASRAGRTTVVQMLLERGAGPTLAPYHLTYTPLMIATYFDRAETVRCLLDYPSVTATVNRRNHNGETALLGRILRPEGAGEGDAG